MIVTNYPLILLSILGLSGIGYKLGAKTLLTAIIISLGTVGMATDVAATFFPAALKYMFFTLFVVGALFHLRDRMSKFQYRDFRSSDPFLLIGTMFLFKSLNSNFYFFQSVDIIVLGSALEMLSADYFSPLRLLTYYPDEMSAFHKLSSGVLAYTLVFFDRPNLIEAADARYTIIVFSLFLFFRTLIEKTAAIRSIVIVIFACSMIVIYGEEIFVVLAVSTWFYILVLFALSYILFVKKETPQTFIILFFILVCAKAPIFYSAFACAILGVAVFWNQLNKYVVLSFSFGVIAVFYSWVAIPVASMTDLTQGFTLYNGFDGSVARVMREGIIATLYGIKTSQPWEYYVMKDPIIPAIKSYFSSVPFLAAYFVLAILIIKIYLCGSLLVKSIGNQSMTGGQGRAASIHQRMAFLVFLYLFVSFAGYLWVRNGTSMGQQLTGALALASLVASLFCVWAALQTNVWRLLWAPILMIAFLPQPGSLLNLGKFSNSSIVYHEAVGSIREPSRFDSMWTADKPLPSVPKGALYYKPKSSELMSDSQLYAAILGLRLKAIDAPGPPATWVNLVWLQGGWYRK